MDFEWFWCWYHMASNGFRKMHPHQWQNTDNQRLVCCSSLLEDLFLLLVGRPGCLQQCQVGHETRPEIYNNRWISFIHTQINPRWTECKYNNILVSVSVQVNSLVGKLVCKCASKWQLPYRIPAAASATETMSLPLGKEWLCHGDVHGPWAI